MSVQVGAHCLEKEPGGSGILLGGVPGVPPRQGRDPRRRRRRHQRRPHGHGPRGQRHRDRQIARPPAQLDEHVRLQAQHRLYATVDAIEQHVIGADLVIGAVLVPGAAAPKLVTPRHAEEDAAGLRPRRRRHRPGRLLRDQPRHDPRRPDLRGRRHRPLLRRQHARRRRRAPPPSRSTTPPCPSRSRSPTRATAAPAPRTCICATASTSTPASSPIRPCLMPSG